MKISRCFFSAAIIAIVVVLFTAPATAHADSYQVFDLGNFTNARQFSGITSSGIVVFFDNFIGLCGVDSSGCYETWVDGTLVSSSATNPSLIYDDGTPCIATIIPPATGSARGICNNGHEVYAYNPNSVSPARGFYDGPDLATDEIGGGEVFQADLNASGDFVFVNGLNPDISDASGEWYEYIDLSTAPSPEPASIFLLGTGILAAARRFRRRL